MDDECVSVGRVSTWPGHVETHNGISCVSLEACGKPTSNVGKLAAFSEARSGSTIGTTVRGAVITSTGTHTHPAGHRGSSREELNTYPTITIVVCKNISTTIDDIAH